MKHALLALIAILLVGCAARPSSIQPAMVSRTQYDNMSCGVLQTTFEAETTNLESLSREQNTSRSWDIALNILLLPGIGALTGDAESEIAQTKGRIIAIQEEFAERCNEDA